MRLVKEKVFIEYRDKLDIRVSTYFALLFGGLLSLIFLLGGDFLIFILVLVFFSAALWGIIFGLRKLANKTVDKRRKRAELPGKILDVLYVNEPGLLSISDDKIIYQTLVMGATNKRFEFDITEDLFIVYGPIQFNKMQQLKYGNREIGYITIKEMPHGQLHQFLFYNIDDTLEKVMQEVEQVNKYKHEKYE